MIQERQPAAIRLVTLKACSKTCQKIKNINQEVLLSLILTEFVDSGRQISVTQHSDTLTASICHGMASLPAPSIQRLNGLNASINPELSQLLSGSNKALIIPEEAEAAAQQLAEIPWEH